jgi:hypothetical protein
MNLNPNNLEVAGITFERSKRHNGADGRSKVYSLSDSECASLVSEFSALDVAV